MNPSYIDLILFNTPNECLKFFSRHHSLIENLNRVFSSLCNIFRHWYGYDHCAHVFWNPDFQEIHTLATCDKIHLILPKEDADVKYPVYAYRMMKLGESLNRLSELIGIPDLRKADRPLPQELSEEKLEKILPILKIEIDTPVQGSGLMIPFSHADLNLGVFLLWGKKDNRRKKISTSSPYHLGWLASLYDFLQSVFIREFEIKDIKKTYLPSLYASRWKKAAILFAEIKNFSLLEERMRQVYAPRDDTGRIRAILNQHCTEMSQIVSAEKGRIERFFGSGLMAIFGEHNESYCEATVSAVSAALSMIDRFNELKPIFLKEIIGDDYEIEYNEHLNIGLSVGIDFGTVLFEYLGGDEHQKFTIIGDHVNMAEFLMTEAGSSSNPVCQRAHLLFSSTVDRLTWPWIDPRKKQCESIYDRIKGRSITAFGISKDDFRYELFNQCKSDSSGRSWDSAWEGSSYQKPY
jgi:class 3 adenylate cyclase